MNDDFKERLKGEFTKSFLSADSFKKNSRTLIEIALYEEFGDKIGRLYSVIGGGDLFSKIIDEFSGTQIQIPDAEEFKSCVMTSLVYYYKEVMGFSWEKVQEALPYERDVGLRYARKIKALNSKMKKRLVEFAKSSE